MQRVLMDQFVWLIMILTTTMMITSFEEELKCAIMAPTSYPLCEEGWTGDDAAVMCKYWGYYPPYFRKYS